MEREIILYTQDEVAQMFKVSTKTLESMRFKGTGPKYSKFGRRVLYRNEEILKFLSENTFNSTSEY